MNFHLTSIYNIFKSKLTYYNMLTRTFRKTSQIYYRKLYSFVNAVFRLAKISHYIEDNEFPLLLNNKKLLVNIDFLGASNLGSRLDSSYAENLYFLNPISANTIAMFQHRT